MVVSLFVVVLVGAVAMLLVRLCRCGKPQFQRLDEVPMVCVGLGGGVGQRWGPCLTPFSLLP